MSFCIKASVNTKVTRTVDELYLHINLWSDEIFSVVFLKDREIANPFKVLPENAHMLIAKPENVGYTVSETDECIDIKTLPIYIKSGTVIKYYDVKDSLQNGIGKIIKKSGFKKRGMIEVKIP